MTKLEELAIQDILSWAIINRAHGKFANFNEMLKFYWSEMLNTSANIDSMWCDGDSSPFTTWDFSSPQPEANKWDLN